MLHPADFLLVFTLPVDLLARTRFLVFDHGQIVEQGTHAKLLAQKGLYAHLFKLQSGGFIVDDQGEPDVEDPETLVKEDFSLSTNYNANRPMN